MHQLLQQTPRRRPTHPAMFIFLLAILIWFTPRALAAQGVESKAGKTAEDSSEPAAEPTWLGVQIAENTDQSEGAGVERILEDSPAERSALKEGDRLLTAAGQNIDDLASLRRALDPHGPGDEIQLEIRREGKKRNLTAVLSARPTERQMLQTQFVGAQLPALDLENLDGADIRLDDQRDKPLVIEFWATWCPPCRRTRQTLAALDQKFGDRIAVIGISPEKRARLEAYRKRADIPYRLLHDPQRTANQQMMVASYPTLFVVDADGTIREVFTGAGHRKALESRLKQLLD